MTTVTIEPNRLSVVGHAGYGKVGYDIVCAGISTLTFTLKESIELYTSDCVEFFIADGKVIASWSELSEKGALLLNSYITGRLSVKLLELSVAVISFAYGTKKQEPSFI